MTKNCLISFPQIGALIYQVSQNQPLLQALSARMHIWTDLSYVLIEDFLVVW